jgi:hypothetical protein
MRPLHALAAGLLLVLAGCGDPGKADILKKAEGADTKAKLEKALGRPTDIGKLGPIEKWTYKAKDGEVVFLITGDTVALQAAGK